MKQKIPVEFRLSSFETEQGILVASAIRDVSSRRKEKKLKEYRNQLEGLVIKRTADLMDAKSIGIGLATVQQIIQRHGGDVWAESSKNEGYFFIFLFRD